MLKYFIATVLLTTCSAHAAMAPQYERQNMLKTIAESEAVLKALQDAPIDLISYAGSDTFTVAGGGCAMSVQLVNVRDVNKDGLGGGIYEVKILKSTCK
jgi:hypothetical protein